LNAAWLNYELKKLWDEVVLTVIAERQRRLQDGFTR
jgi:hypothetical protein